MAQNTKQMIQEALLQLLNEKEFGAIRIQDVIQRSYVSRHTFYYYFPNIYAVLDGILWDKVDEILQRPNRQSAWYDSLCRFSRWMITNRLAFLHVYQSCREDFLRSMRDPLFKIVQGFNEDAAEGKRVEESDLKLLIYLHFYSISGLIQKWLEEGAPASKPEETFRRIAYLFDGFWDEIFRRSSALSDSNRGES